MSENEFWQGVPNEVTDRESKSSGHGVLTGFQHQAAPLAMKAARLRDHLL